MSSVNKYISNPGNPIKYLLATYNNKKKIIFNVCLIPLRSNYFKCFH